MEINLDEIKKRHKLPASYNAKLDADNGGVTIIEGLVKDYGIPVEETDIDPANENI